jgi:hypothetical protein
MDITEQFYPFLPLHEYECMASDNGVRIVVFGREMNGCQTIFIYEYFDIKFELKAHRSSKDWISYEKPGIDDWSDFALGPSCVVWLDTRGLRPLSNDEWGMIRDNITEFLVKEFHRCRTAIAPYPVAVEYLLG